MSHHQVPDKPFDTFMVQAQGSSDYMLDVISVETDQGVSMVICTQQAAIYVSREQAKAFFNLGEIQEQGGLNG